MSGGNDEQDQLEQDLADEQAAQQAQEASLKKRQEEIKTAETTNMKRQQGAGQMQADMAEDEDEDMLG